MSLSRQLREWSIHRRDERSEEMSITSWSFALFLAIVLLAYYTVLAGRRQWICLLVASVSFYLFAGPKNLVYLMLTALTCWLGGRCLHGLETDGTERIRALSSSGAGREERKALKRQVLLRKRWVLWIVLAINFGILALVKYWGVAYRGWLLPLGISFYTFQSVGYLLDCYNGKIQPERSFLRYFLFISFFPQLIQGPIARYEALSPQLQAQHRFSFEGCKRSLLIIGLGLVKKYAVANVLAPCIAALLDDHIGTIPGSAVMAGILMYSFQQYADFSGGIDMVTGYAGLFGIELALNFRQPYLAVSLGDFWRRWHISLGAWMRDYVFYPFALLKPVQRLGKRISKRFGKHLGVVLPASIANLLVFFLVGLWHGAQLHYIVWGVYNGLVIALSDICAPAFQKLGTVLHVRTDTKGGRVLCIVRTFIIVNIGWYFDRIERFGDCLHALYASVVPGLIRFSDLGRTLQAVLMDTNVISGKGILLAAAGILIMAIVDVLHERKRTLYDILAAYPRAVRWSVFYAGMVLIQLAVDFSNASSAFLYAGF